MTVMSDKWIREQCTLMDKPMITPFYPESVSRTDYVKHPSFGLSSYGYDVRLGNKFSVMKKPVEVLGPHSPVIDTRTGVPEEFWTHIESDVLELEPNECALGYTMEYVRVPNDVLVICMAKSSIARVFCQACVTPLESGWNGHITIELHNPTHYRRRVHAGDGIMQMLFIKGDQPCEVTYASRNGKYQNQPAHPVPAR